MVLRKTLRYFSQASALLSTLALVLALTACGGGGGGGGGTPSLLGNVSDSTRLPMTGVSVAAYDDTGMQVGSATSDAAGRYTLLNLPTGKPLTIVATGPAGTFPAQSTDITLVAGMVSLLDFYLPSTAVASSPAAGIYESAAVLRFAQVAVLNVNGTTFSAAPTEIYLAPFDVNEIGNGYPVYSVSPLAIGDSSITELFAAAAVEMSNGGSDVTFDSADLYLPIPLNLVATTPATADLYRFDPTTSAYVVEGTATLTTDPVNGDPAYLAAITTSGLYRVGAAATADSTLGTILYQDLTPAAGITVFVTGDDYGYQQVAMTDANGQFTALTKTGGSSRYEFVAWGYGLQLSATAAAASTTLPFNEPAVNTPAATSITLASAGPVSIGLIAASGRMSTDPEVIDGTPTTPGRADVSFTYDAFNGLTLNGTTRASGIQEITGASFESLGVAPATGYSAYDGFTFPSITINPAGGQVFAVKTDVGYAKISIDSVSGSDPYTLEIRARFSLTGRF